MADSDYGFPESHGHRRRGKAGLMAGSAGSLGKRRRGSDYQTYMNDSSCEAFLPHIPLLEFPKAEIPTMQVVMMKNIITQYSIVVAASSLRWNLSQKLMTLSRQM